MESSETEDIEDIF